MAEYIIRRMQENEVPIAIDWAKKEGWNPGLHDAACFYETDKQGFFIGLLDGEPIAVGSAVIYDDAFAFCGLYIVKEGFRKQGYGMKLTEERLKYVGNRITGIDGVVENVSIYARIGYVTSHKHIRYELTERFPFSPSKHIVDLNTIPFSEIEAFDRQFFPAPRSKFLKCWVHQIDHYGCGYLLKEKLEGYGVIRKCFLGYKIGPLYASSLPVAKALFETLSSKAAAGPIYLDIPEPNKWAKSLVKDFKMKPKFEVMRMYRNGMPKINLLDGVYGITTCELG